MQMTTNAFPVEIASQNPVIQVRMLRAAGYDAATINMAKQRAAEWDALGRPRNWYNRPGGGVAPVAAPTQSLGPIGPATRPLGAPQFDPNNPDYVEDFTVYQLSFLALAPGATATQAIAIQADSAFKWTKAAYSANIAAAAFTENTRPIPNVTVQILDTGSGRQLFNAAVPVPSIFGTGMLPYILPVERWFQERSSMQVTVANFDAAVTYNLLLSFEGSKVFKYSAI